MPPLERVQGLRIGTIGEGRPSSSGRLRHVTVTMEGWISEAELTQVKLIYETRSIVQIGGWQHHSAETRSEGDSVPTHNPPTSEAQGLPPAYPFEEISLEDDVDSILGNDPPGRFRK